MINVGICTLEMSLPASSLKDKRRVVKSVCKRLHNQFNVAVAEVDCLDNRQTAVLAVVTVSNDRDYAHGLLMRVIQWIEETRLDCCLEDYSIEMMR